MSVEVEGINPANSKKVKGNVVPQGNGDLAIPKPGQPDITVTVTTSDGPKPFTNVEKAPDGTRIAVKLDKGATGGHTRDAWTAATNSYGDKIKVTGEQKIGFNLPDGAGPVDLSAISSRRRSPRGGRRLGNHRAIPRRSSNGARTSTGSRITRASVHELEDCSPKEADAAADRR